MIAVLALIAAQAAPLAPAARQDCVRAIGSEIAICGTPPQAQQGPPAAQAPQANYRIPRLRPKAYGPAVPKAQADLGNGVRAKATNSGRGRRNKSAATLSVPF